MRRISAVLTTEVSLMRRILIPLALTLLACALAPASRAAAATYTVWSCANAAGKPLSAGDWSPSTAGSQVASTTTCGANVTGATAGNMQALAAAGPGQPDTSISAAWTVRATPGTKISALDVWWTNSASIQVPGRVQIYAGATSLYSRDAGSFGNVRCPSTTPATGSRSRVSTKTPPPSSRGV
jgi:hypothetical protein